MNIFEYWLVATGVQNVQLVNFTSDPVHFAVEILDGRRIRIAEFVIQKPKNTYVEFNIERLYISWEMERLAWPPATICRIEPIRELLDVGSSDEVSFATGLRQVQR